MAAVNALLRAGAAGLLATLVMTLVMLGKGALGLWRTPPPQIITAGVERRLGFSPRLDSPWFQLRWLCAHFAYGATWGIVYRLARPYLPAPGGAPGGIAWGMLVWALNYLGLMPLVRLYPPPDRDDPVRQAGVVLEHGVYGSVLAACERWLARASS